MLHILVYSHGFPQRVGMGYERDDILRRAFDDTVEDFGSSIREAVKADLNSRLVSSNGERIDLLTISKCLEKFFGQGSSELIISRIIARADELYTDRKYAETVS
jgi:hypothetical protein